MVIFEDRFDRADLATLDGDNGWEVIGEGGTGGVEIVGSYATNLHASSEAPHSSAPK